MKKKVLFFVMTMIASVFIMPSAFAYAEGTVATVGSEEFTSLQDAINNGNSNEKILLVADTNEDIIIAADQNITIDLGGYTITNVSNHTIINNGILTITGNGTVDNVTHAKATIYNNAGGTVTINGGTYQRSNEAGVSSSNNGGNSYYTILNHGKMTVNDAKVYNNGKYSSMFENGWQNGAQNTTKVNSELILNDGTYSGGLNTIKNDDYGVITINGGHYSNYAQAAVLNWNTAEINDGTFESEYKTILNGQLDNTMDKGELVINGGTFRSGSNQPIIEEMGQAKSIGTIEINGGTYDVAATNLISVRHQTLGQISITGGVYTVKPDEDDIPEGYEIFDNEDGTYTIAKPVTLTFNANGVTESVTVPAGSHLTAEEAELLKQEVINALGSSEFTFDGFFIDEAYTTEFDFTKPFENDVTVYMKLTQKRTEEQNPSQGNTTTSGEENKQEATITNPDTSDINIIALLGTMIISGAGLGFTIRKRFN